MCLTYSILSRKGHEGAQIDEALRYKSEGSGFDSLCCNWNFLWHYGPGVDSASKRNDYQEYFLGGRGRG